MSGFETMSNEVVITNDSENSDNCSAKEVKKRRVVRRKKTVTNNEFDVKIPSYSEYEYVNDKRLKVPDLKAMCKHYKLKVTGNKNQLQTRLYDFLFESNKCYQLQAVFRRLLVSAWLESHGPALFDRTKAVNTTDFATMDDIEEISADQLFSFVESKSDTIYVFDAGSFATLIKGNILSYRRKAKNPYTMEDLDRCVFLQFNRFIRLSKVLNRNVEYEIKDDDSAELDSMNQPQLSITQRINRLFQEIDSYGHYTSGDWMEGMSNLDLRHFIYEVIQIFEYRAHLSSNQRARIIPPSGIIHRGNVRTWLAHNLGDRQELLEKAVFVSELLVFSGLERDNRQLGCYYVLMALTLCSEEARSAMPWLYEAASYTSNS